MALLAVTVVGWLALAGLTASGAVLRGQGKPLALLAGLVFPITWVAWYVHDEHPARR